MRALPVHPTGSAYTKWAIPRWLRLLHRRFILATTEYIEARLAGWRQTPETKLPGPDAAPELIERAGIVTLFPASPEVPNLYHAYMGDPEAPAAAEWDSPAGQVYGWRWTLGRKQTAFYTAIVRKRPTWVSWALLPAVIRLCGDLREPEELYQAGELSRDGLRIAQALASTGGVLSTGELRKEAGFPTGKAERAAYLKAVEELDTRLLLAKVFSAEDEDMRHALVRVAYPAQVAAAEQMTSEQAADRFLETYLPLAVFAAPVILAKHVRLSEAVLRAGLDRMAAGGRVTVEQIEGYKGPCYVWRG